MKTFDVMCPSDAGIIRKLAMLWRVHRDHQFFYKTVMQKQTSALMRALCGQGYFIASVCKQEIGTLYNTCRSPVFHGELSAYETERTGLLEWLGQMPDDVIYIYLKRKQTDLLKKYLGFVKQMQENDACLGMILDHIFMIRELINRETKMQENADFVRTMFG